MGYVKGTFEKKNVIIDQYNTMDMPPSHSYAHGVQNSINSIFNIGNFEARYPITVDKSDLEMLLHSRDH